MENNSHANEQLTDEQIENWRRVLVNMFGPYALLMPKEEIQRHRDKMQGWANRQSNGRHMAVDH